MLIHIGSLDEVGRWDDVFRSKEGKIRAQQRRAERHEEKAEELTAKHGKRGGGKDERRGTSRAYKIKHGIISGALEDAAGYAPYEAATAFARLVNQRLGASGATAKVVELQEGAGRVAFATQVTSSGQSVTPDVAPVADNFGVSVSTLVVSANGQRTAYFIFYPG